MKMYRNILSTVLVFIVACSVAEAGLNEGTLQTVNSICKQTTDTNFCRRLYVQNLMTSSPSKKDLLNVTLGAAEKNSGNTYFFIGTLLRNAGDERDDLQTCAEAYSIINLAFTNALSFFNQGHYSEIPTLVPKVSTAIDMCKTGFNVPGFEINPLIEKNREMMILLDMEKIVGHMVSS